MAESEALTESVTLGHPDELALVLAWRDDYGPDGPVGCTWGDLQVWVRSTLVWGSWCNAGTPTGIRWSWIDLLEFLAVAWPYLQEEETYPIDFPSALDAPRHLGELPGRARLRWRGINENEADREDESLRTFLAVHDFGQSLAGASSPSLILLRQGHRMLAATRQQEWALDFKQTLATLEQFGNLIAQRIAVLNDDRSRLATERWLAREALSPGKRLEAATGLALETLREAWPTPFEGPGAYTPVYELKAAARMIGTELPPSDLRAILTRIGELPIGTLSIPEGVRELVDDMLREHADEEPYVQGYGLAHGLRAYIGVESGRTDPEALLGNWSVAVEEIEIEADHLDAIAVWSEHHCPTVFVNKRGLRSRFPTGRRSTCAHEICHLLVDRDRALPAVEVLGGRIPRGIEQRANAFAAEFLLPRVEVGRFVKASLEYVYSPDERKKEIERMVSRLAEDYDVSHETAAWQMLQSGQIGECDEQVLNSFLKSIYKPYK